MTTTELNKRACFLLGIHWHERESNTYHSFRCSCGFESGDREYVDNHINNSNFDFTTPSGRIELLEILKRKDLLDEFISLSQKTHWFEIDEWIENFFIGEPTALVEAVIEFLEVKE